MSFAGKPNKILTQAVSHRKPELTILCQRCNGMLQTADRAAANERQRVCYLIRLSASAAMVALSTSAFWLAS
jgi:hypothetical protein